MKTLLIVRHAKSSWANPELIDFDRPLNARGKRDAPLMGKLLLEKNKIPDVIISSLAKRAKKTAQKISKEIDYQKDKIIFLKNLYHAHPEQIMKITRGQSDDFQTLMLVGHNPGMTDFVNQFTDFYLENIPTCGICEIQFDVEKWENIDTHNSRFITFEYPKKYL